ncbi:hypothetical protein [Paenibacillus sp. J2TS4]|uniref:hypothetical protein n=1 Tax=Paenibacillus sp. J2TS4 TaxID=2807194 RepID=UPI001B040285|nr:hypothetical protein [Paenibacillus sp. J2TS4]GIP32609.1 hypothetical protein J2TS4_18190 [Paenibacillus sp. J2TS4]
MRYGVREICNVVLKDVTTKEPVVYLESLTTSSLETSGETVYARGGRGNPKLIGWDSDKEIVMNMEDALISKASLSVLVGNEFKATAKPVHKKEVLSVTEDGGETIITLSKAPTAAAGYPSFFYATSDGTSMDAKLTGTVEGNQVKLSGDSLPQAGDQVIADYYVEAPAKAESIVIDSSKFPGTYLLEGETLWRNEAGKDVPALFTIPKLKVKPNFTIGMAASGDAQPFSFETEVLKDSASTAMVIIDVLED